MTARATIRMLLGLERPPDAMPGVRDADSPCADFEPGTPSGTDCYTDGHYLCRECVHAPEQDPFDETPTITHDPERGWVDLR